MKTFLLLLLLQIPHDPSVLTVPKVEAASLDYSTTTLQAFATDIAKENDLDVEKFLATITCESNWEPRALGDGGTSIGIAQFRYPPRFWGISTSTAYDPYASIELMGKAWKEGKQNLWSCYKIVSH